MPTRRRTLPRAAVLATLIALPATGHAQAPAAQTPQPTSPAVQIPLVSPLENPFLRRERARFWNARLQIDLQMTITHRVYGGNRVSPIPFSRIEAIAPVVDSTSFSVKAPDSHAGELYLNNTVMDTTPELLGPWHSWATYARYVADVPTEVAMVRLVHNTRSVAWDTDIDEALANSVEWPKGSWPIEALGTFGPQQFINPVGQPELPVADLLARWLNGAGPRDVPPYRLAKLLAGRVMAHVRINGDGLSRPGTLAGAGVEGVDIRGAALTALTGRGSAHDMSCLLVAVYRAAGIPCRLVIASESDEDIENIGVTPDGAVFVDETQSNPASAEFRTIVEFFLYDEARDLKGWIPVEISRLQADRGNTVPPLEQEWRFFGTHDELRLLAPIALHYIPPAAVRTYNAPATVGFRFFPHTPAHAAQNVSVDVGGTAVFQIPGVTLPTP